LQNTSGSVAVWLMESGRPVVFADVWPYETNDWRVVETLDLNDDDTLDILLQFHRER